MLHHRPNVLICFTPGKSIRTTSEIQAIPPSSITSFDHHSIICYHLYTVLCKISPPVESILSCTVIASMFFHVALLRCECLGQARVVFVVSVAFKTTGREAFDSTSILLSAPGTSKTLSCFDTPHPHLRHSTRPCINACVHQKARFVRCLLVHRNAPTGHPEAPPIMAWRLRGDPSLSVLTSENPGKL